MLNSYITTFIIPETILAKAMLKVNQYKTLSMKIREKSLGTSKPLDLALLLHHFLLPVLRNLQHISSSHVLCM